jgi:hypothetical protein
MKSLSIYFAGLFVSSFALAATPPMSEILTQAHCKPQRSAGRGQVKKFHCTNSSSDSVQMKGLQGTAEALSGEDEFSAFEREATDLSHAHDAESEIEIE